ncbi:hypothetical protein GCM10009810_01480 [Nostocoides vanveenii]|uniref:Uncharacterized protein n=1 Tax=Nostocoides vanveenii TaxID=330835 RepID=A0ABN2JZJ5_9MICO
MIDNGLKVGVVGEDDTEGCRQDLVARGDGLAERARTWENRIRLVIDAHSHEHLPTPDH